MKGYGRALSVGFGAGNAAMAGLSLSFVVVSLFVVRLGPRPDGPEWWVALAQRARLYVLAVGDVVGALVGGRSRHSRQR